MDGLLQCSEHKFICTIILNSTDLSFSYQIKEVQRHGEAASVDTTAGEAERIHVCKLLAKYKPEDHFNGDETALYIGAMPDRGLSSEQMSGKKENKFCLSCLLVCNTTGSEKFPILYIGKVKCPQCFRLKTPEQLGFYYCNNKKAWMTSQIFKEYVHASDFA